MGLGGLEAQRAIRIVQRAIKLGINVLDTAEIYGKGLSETIVGEAIADHREQVLLASTVFPICPVPSRIRLAAACSLKRLRSTQIDLYQLHRYNPLVPLRIQMSGMRDLRESGQIRYIGVSNFSRRQWQRAEAALGNPVHTNQVQYGLLQTKPESDLTTYARDRIPSSLHTVHLPRGYYPESTGLITFQATYTGSTGSFARKTFIGPCWWLIRSKRLRPGTVRHQPR